MTVYVATLDEFSFLLDNAVPLVLDHAEVNFDDTISTWMGQSVYKNYTRFKSSPIGITTSPNNKVRQLFEFWKEEVGEEANINGFIKLIRGKPLTNNIVGKLTRIQNHMDAGNDKSSFSSHQRGIGKGRFYDQSNKERLDFYNKQENMFKCKNHDNMSSR